MKKLLLQILFILGLCVIVVILAVEFMEYKISGNKVINYYINNYQYVIKPKKIFITVEKMEAVTCIKEPCNKVMIDSYKIRNNSEYKELFAKILGNNKKATIIKENLEESELKLINDLVKLNEEERIDLTYSEISTDENDSYYDKKGYYLETINDRLILTVSLGEKFTGGYTIINPTVKISNNELEITFEEGVPAKDTTVTEVLTYPTVRYELNKRPKSITVKNISTYEIYKEIVK